MVNASNRIELHKEDMKFSIAHFTIFTPEQRENLHGHNYQVHASFAMDKHQDGLSLDYRELKKQLRDICNELDETLILPGKCAYIRIQETNTHYHLHFNQEEMLFLKRDVKILPITNVTVEELSKWFLQQILQNETHLVKHAVTEIDVKIYSGPGQAGSACWRLG